MTIIGAAIGISTDINAANELFLEVSVEAMADTGVGAVVRRIQKRSKNTNHISSILIISRF